MSVTFLSDTFRNNLCPNQSSGSRQFASIDPENSVKSSEMQQLYGSGGPALHSLSAFAVFTSLDSNCSAASGRLGFVR